MSPGVVGFLGAGRMGGPMVRRLLHAGHDVVVFDPNPAACSSVAAHGARIASSAAEVARATDLTISIVMDDRILRRVALAEDGVLAGASPGHLYCDLSTVSPMASAEVADRAAEAEVSYLRGKVAGSVPLAEAGTLTVFTSGERADHDRAMPVLSALGERVLYVGGGEASHFLKLAHSVLVAGYAALVGEAITLAHRGGVDYDLAIDVLESGPLASRQLTLKAPMLHSREFAEPPSDIDTAAKDLDLVLASSRAARVPMPLTGLVRELMAGEQAHGDGASDIWSVIRAFERLAGPASPHTSDEPR